MCAGAQGRQTMDDQASWPCEERMCALLQAVWPPRLSRNHGEITYAIASSFLDMSLRLSAPGDGGHSRRSLHHGVPETTAGQCAVRPLGQNITFCQGMAWTQRTENQYPYQRPSNLGYYHPPLRGGGWGSFIPTSRPQTRSRKGPTFGALHAQGALGSRTAWLPSGSPAPGRRKPSAGYGSLPGSSAALVTP